MVPKLTGVVMELNDGAYPLLDGATGGSDPEWAFADTVSYSPPTAAGAQCIGWHLISWLAGLLCCFLFCPPCSPSYPSPVDGRRTSHSHCALL